MIDCRDILDVVYINVKASYIERLYSKKVKNITINENTNMDENLQKTTLNDPEMVTQVNSKENTGLTTEKVSEELERMPENKVISSIMSELEEKVPYALASVCANLAKLDRIYREIRGFENQPEFSEYALEVGDDFPLSERFVLPCVLFCSSMAIIEIDEDKCDKFYNRYVASVNQIVSEMPWEMQKIVEKYSY